MINKGSLLFVRRKLRLFFPVAFRDKFLTADDAKAKAPLKQVGCSACNRLASMTQLERKNKKVQAKTTVKLTIPLLFFL